MSLAFFIILLAILMMIGMLKYRESKTGTPSAISTFISRGDPLVEKYIRIIWNSISKLRQSAQSFLLTHVPHYSVDFYSKFKTMKNLQRERLLENFRGKQDFSNKGASSLFLWHISPGNDSEKKGKK